jgi:hypothetical protein
MEGRELASLQTPHQPLPSIGVGLDAAAGEPSDALLRELAFVLHATHAVRRAIRDTALLVLA